MPPSRPQDPRTLKIRDEEDQIKTLGPHSKQPGADPNEAEATVFPGADATVAPGDLEAPKPRSMVRGGAALTRPPVSDNEPATAPGKMAQPAIAAPRPAASAGSAAPANAANAAREVPVVKPRHPTETVLRPRAKGRSSWVMWLFAFLVLGGIGFGVSWFLINPSSTSSAPPEAANTTPTPAPSPEPSPEPAEPDTEAKAEPDAAVADGEPNAAPLPTEIAGADAAAQPDGAADAQADGQTAAQADAAPDGQADGQADAQVAAAGTDTVAPETQDGAADAQVAAPAEGDTAQPAQPDTQVAAAPVAPAAVPRNPAESNRLNEAGLVARKAGDHARAMQLYQEALKFNPDSVWARYNLACELALAGRSKEAFAELTALYKLDTAESRRALAAARKDSDFDSIRDSGQFFRLTNF